MGKYTVTHTCGHDKTYHLFGPHKDRDRKTEWLAELTCPRCRANNEGPTAYVTRHLHDGADGATIDVVNSFEVKDVLKSRGYRFGSERINTYSGTDLLKILGNKPRPSWYIVLEKQQVDDEIAWLREQGWSVVIRAGIASAISAVINGRPEVVIPQS